MSIESRILGKQFESLFNLDNLQLPKIKFTVNKNLHILNHHIFNPILSIKNLKSKLKSVREQPFFNKFYHNLSSEGLSILETPFEAIFVTLSKISWNKKLKLNKKAKIRNTCYMISGVKSPEELTAKESRKEEERLEIHNLLCIKDIYQSLFKIMSLT